MADRAGVMSSARAATYTAFLVDRGVITEGQASVARAANARTGVHVDDVLVSLGMAQPEALVAATSSVWRIPAVDLEDAHSVDLEYVRRFTGRDALVREWLPIAREADGRVVVAIAHRPEVEDVDAAEQLVGASVRFVATSAWALRRAVLRIFADRIADAAANDLFRQNPLISARTVFARWQQVVAIAVGVVVLLGLVLAPLVLVIVLLALASVAFLASILFKFSVSMWGAQFDVVERISDRDVADLDDRDLPRYTILVPVYRESNIVAQLVGNLGGIDYPVEKLEVLVLMEEDDDETRAAFDAASPPAHFQVVTVPAGTPKTKPRACNVGLAFATGELLVIYDAEDAPEPDQLKKAVLAFRHGGDALVCVQAALSYFNATENLLTRMFTLEYNSWFDYMLPGLDVLELPIPLGGTSNHFRVDALQELGGWDPYNVTEDADLGIRASALGYRVGVVNSTTFEEANTSIPNFVRQRSRWIKGYMQTSLVHSRDPIALVRRIGFVRFASFVLLIGGTPAAFLAVLPFYALTVASFVVPSEWIAQVFPLWLLWLCLLNFIIGNVVIVYLTMMGPYKRGSFNLILWALLNPIYWILHSVASYKALWQLLFKPHYWEKTAHGLTSQSHH